MESFQSGGIEICCQNMFSSYILRRFPKNLSLFTGEKIFCVIPRVVGACVLPKSIVWSLSEIYPTEPIRRFFARLPSTIVPASTDAGGVCLLTGSPRQFLTAEFPGRALIRKAVASDCQVGALGRFCRPCGTSPNGRGWRRRGRLAGAGAEL